MWWIRVINFSYGITLKIFIFPTNAMPTRMAMARKLEANQPGYLIYEFTKLALTSCTDNPHYFNIASVYALPLKISKRLSVAGLGASYGTLRIPNSRCTGLRGKVRLSLACSTPLSSVLDAIFKPIVKSVRHSSWLHPTSEDCLHADHQSTTLALIEAGYRLIVMQ